MKAGSLVRIKAEPTAGSFLLAEGRWTAKDDSLFLVRLAGGLPTAFDWHHHSDPIREPLAGLTTPSQCPTEVADGIERRSKGTKAVGVAEEELVETGQDGLPIYPQATAF